MGLVVSGAMHTRAVTPLVPHRSPLFSLFSLSLVAPGPGGFPPTEEPPWSRRTRTAVPRARGGSRMIEESRFAKLYALLIAAAGDDELTPGVLCRVAVDHLGLAAAAVTVPSEQLVAQTIGSYGVHARDLEELQATIGHGPSLDGLAGALPVLIEDIERPEYRTRWPLFVAAAADTGLKSMCVLPMRAGGARFGVLALYLDRVGGLDREQNADARIFARTAMELLVGHTRANRIDADDPSRDAQFYDDRPEIHQATGMVSAQLGVDLATALLRLRGRAFAEGCLLSELAIGVVLRKIRFEGEQA